MNLTEIERIRLRLGISRPDMRRLLGYAPNIRRPFQSPHPPDPIFLRRAHELERYYDEWKQFVITTAATSAPLYLKQLAQILGTNEERMTSIHHLGMFGADHLHRKGSMNLAPWITCDGIATLFASNETYLAHYQNHSTGIGARGVPRRAPISTAFLHWLRRNHWGFIRASTPEKPKKALSGVREYTNT